MNKEDGKQVERESVDYDVSEPSITQKMRGRAITGAEAIASAHRLINSHFRNPDRARCSIPAQVTDDDIVVIDFIRERMAVSTPEAAGRGDERVWGILYHDAAVLPDIFIGEGAEDAARATYKRRSDSWACHLVMSAPPCVKLAAVSEHQTENPRKPS